MAGSSQSGLKIVFLDVDGVLNSIHTKDTCGDYVGIDDRKVALLKAIIDATEAEIVLVSSWKQGWFKESKDKKKQDRMANYLDAKLAKQGLSVLDKTEEEYFMDRGFGILEYLDRLAQKGITVHRYIILDDELFDYEIVNLKSRLIMTDYYVDGLEPKHVERAIELLC